MDAASGRAFRQPTPAAAVSALLRAASTCRLSCRTCSRREEEGEEEEGEEEEGEEEEGEEEEEESYRINRHTR